jgi:hypothetical protein
MDFGGWVGVYKELHKKKLVNYYDTADPQHENRFVWGSVFHPTNLRRKTKGAI